MQETRNQKTKSYVQHKKHNDRSKSLLISNYFRCKLIKLSTQKTKLYKIDKKTYDPKKKPIWSNGRNDNGAGLGSGGFGKIHIQTQIREILCLPNPFANPWK